MRCYLVLVAGTLLSVAGAVAQQSAPVPTEPAGSNVIPNAAMKGAIFRALSAPKVPRPLTTTPSTFRIAATTSNVCAIPLLEAHGTETHDRITVKSPAHPIDPKM